MTDLWIIFAVLAGWFVLMAWLLPLFGVST